MKYTEKSQSIIFHHQSISGDLFRYLTERDTLVLLNRLPLEAYQHLKSITFKTCEGADAYGFVYHKRINSIVICDLAQRLSIRTASAKRGALEEFGALPNMKWPRLAVRRYLLYHTFLHELKHTQLKKTPKQGLKAKMPNEKQANDYANYWRGELYKQDFDHPDPVHNLPSKTELENLQTFWPLAMKHLQVANRHYGRKDYLKAIPAYELAVQQMKLYYGNWDTNQADINKLEETITRLKGWSVTIVLSKKPDADLYDATLKILLNDFAAKMKHEDDSSPNFKQSILEIDGFVLELSLHLLGVQISPVESNKQQKLSLENPLFQELKTYFENYPK